MVAEVAAVMAVVAMAVEEASLAVQVAMERAAYRRASSPRGFRTSLNAMSVMREAQRCEKRCARAKRVQRVALNASCVHVCV